MPGGTQVEVTTGTGIRDCGDIVHVHKNTRPEVWWAPQHKAALLFNVKFYGY